MANPKRDLRKEKRHLRVNVADQSYGDNSIKTSKYTFYNFLLLNLIEQFKKPANVYFLAAALLQIIPAITISNSEPTILIPLLFVVIVSMIKDWVEDSKRSKSDSEENNSKVLVFRNGAFVPEKWSKVWTGEIVKVLREEFLPADLLLISTSSPKQDCFIETKNLDGETNLKVKFVHPSIREVVQDGKLLDTFYGAEFFFEAPSPLIYEFSGSVTCKGAQIGIDINNFPLRSCKLKNTDWIIGVVSFNGHYTKIMMNSIKAKPKKSDIEDKVGWLLIWLFGLLVIKFNSDSPLFSAVTILHHVVQCAQERDRLHRDWRCQPGTRVLCEARKLDPHLRVGKHYQKLCTDLVVGDNRDGQVHTVDLYGS